jgi:hypothetical protein
MGSIKSGPTLNGATLFFLDRAFIIPQEIEVLPTPEAVPAITTLGIFNKPLQV